MFQSDISSGCIIVVNWVVSVFNMVVKSLIVILMICRCDISC